MTSTLAAVRLWLLVVLLIGLLGMGVELLFLKHTDGAWQLAPLILIVLSLIAVGWFGAARSAMSVRALQGMMALFLASGIVGTFLHFRGNMAYEREANPSLSGIELYKNAIMGASPSLAPGAMIQLGLIGLVFTYRHPALARRARDEDHLEQRDEL